METQARKSAQFDARGQGMPQESAGMLQAFKDFRAAYGAFHGRDINIREGQFAIDFDICYENLVQARITDLPDE